MSKISKTRASTEIGFQVIDTAFQVIDERIIGEDEFFYVHLAVFDYIKEIGCNGVALYAVLCSHTRIGREYLQQSISTLAKELKMSKSTIIKYLKKLEAANIIYIERHTGKVSTIYLLKIEPKNQD